MPLAQSRAIQAGLPAMDFGGTAQVAGEVVWEEQVGNSMVVREPIGVVGAITPWNYPLHQLCAKVAPALAAGCSVVAKPSEVTPLSAFVLAEIIDEVGLPRRRLQPRHRLRPGRRRGDRGPRRRRHGLVHRARPAPASCVSEAAAGNVKRVSLELGGKSANVILDDADLKRAVSHGVANCLLNSGQTCSAHTRMLVPREKLEEAEEIAAAAAEKMAPGRPVRARRAHRPARLRRAANARARVHREGREGGREARRRRRRAARGARDRLLRAADRVLRRRRPT